MTVLARGSRLATLFAILLVGLAAPSTAQTVRDEILARMKAGLVALGATNVSWGEVSGSDERFTVEDLAWDGVLRRGKSETPFLFVAARVTFSGGRLASDGGYEVAEFVAQEGTLSADEVTIRFERYLLEGYAAPAPERLDPRLGTLAGARITRVRIENGLVSEAARQAIAVPFALAEVVPTSWSAGMMADSTGVLRGLDVPLPDDLRRSFIELTGQERLVFDGDLASTWDAETGAVAASKLDLTARGLFKLSFPMAFGGLTTERLFAFQDADPEKPAELLRVFGPVSLVRVAVRYEDLAFAQRALAALAEWQGLTGEQLREQTEAGVEAALAVFGDPDLTARARRAVADFMVAPKSFEVRLEPSAHASIVDIVAAATTAPNTLARLLGLDVRANQ